MRITIALAVAAAVIGLAPQAYAQEGPGGLINPGKDCQTILHCQFKRGGRYRGCISAYSCRQCRFVKANCSIGNQRGTCRRLRCTWG